MVEVLSSDFLKMPQATISLRRVGLQLPTAKPDLDQAYQDRDAENAIGYNTLDTFFFFFKDLFLMCCSYSCRVCQASRSLCLRRKQWLDCHVEGHKKEPITAQFLVVVTRFLG